MSNKSPEYWMVGNDVIVTSVILVFILLVAVFGNVQALKQLQQEKDKHTHGGEYIIPRMVASLGIIYSALNIPVYISCILAGDHFHLINTY